MAEEQAENDSSNNSSVVNTLSDDLAAAWDEFEEEETHDVELQSTDSEDGSTEQSTDENTVTGADDSGDTDPVPETGKQVPEESTQDNDKPPVGLSAPAREAWKDAPKAIKDELAKREKDYATGIQRYAESAQRSQAMDKALAPYSQLFAMNGGAQQTLPGLLQTASVLQMGSAPQKAEMVAGLIKQFGVDIQTLDNVLSGQPDVPRGTQQNPDLDRMLQEKLAPYQQFMNQVQQNQAAQAAQSQQVIGNELQTFANDPKNEFYSDVSSIMADQLEVAARNGQNMTLPEAYRIGCMLHPDVSNIMDTRKSTPSSKKRRAASSIHGSPSGEGGGNEGNLSMTDAINAAWDAQGRA